MRKIKQVVPIAKYVLVLTLAISAVFLANVAVYAAIPTQPSFKVAFIGDSGQGTNFQNVLNLIKGEGVDLVVHQGDFSYNGTSTWINRVDNTLGSNFPYLGSIGNHDTNNWGDIRSGCKTSTFAGYFRCKLNKMGVSSVPTSGSEQYSAIYKGLKLVFVNENGGSSGANWVNQQLSGDDHIWKICSWHKNQSAMQVGGKGNSVGWQVYENCRQQGAIIATAHEHSYERTRTLTSVTNQTVDSGCSDPNNLCVEPGRTFVFVSGLGGASIRDQERCFPSSFPYGCKGEWGKIYTSDQGAKYGALFIEFNINGDPNRAHGYFKNINGQIIDDFNITKGGGDPIVTSTPTPIGQPTATPTSTPVATKTPTLIPNPGGKFKVGDRVEVTDTANVKSTPGTGLLGTQPPGARGTVLEGPELGAGGNHWWWRINYDSGPDGWSREDLLKVVSTPTVTPIPTSTPVPTPTPIPGDIDGDGDVDNDDYQILLSEFGKTSSSAADIDEDNDVDIFDYNIVVENFGFAATPTPTGPLPTVPPPTGSSGIWISASRLAGLPTSGSAWNNVQSEADRSAGTPDLANQDDRTNVTIMAKALVFARTGQTKYRSEVLSALGYIANSGTYSGRALALGRELAAYVISADLIDLKVADPSLDNKFRNKIRELLTTYTDGGPSSLIKCHEDRPNNWGTHCGGSRAAVAAYLGDSGELARTAQVFRGWLGDRGSYAGFKYGSLDWQCDSSRPVGINPVGCTKQGRNIDGVLPDDQRRAGGFQWPPPKENYVWEGLQGGHMQAVVLYNAGYDVFNWENQALRRAVTWLHEQANFPAEGDDTWEPHITNYYYGTNFPTTTPSRPGKNAGWTDWTHAR